jgi:hypothetical protein
LQKRYKFAGVVVENIVSSLSEDSCIGNMERRRIELAQDYIQ